LYTIFLGFKTVKNIPSSENIIIFTAFLFVVISGFFDHFYITLQQGMLMFWVITAMLYNKVGFIKA